jgi:hypothetical protein
MGTPPGYGVSGSVGNQAQAKQARPVLVEMIDVADRLFALSLQLHGRAHELCGRLYGSDPVGPALQPRSIGKVEPSPPPPTEAASTLIRLGSALETVRVRLELVSEELQRLEGLA